MQWNEGAYGLIPYNGAVLGSWGSGGFNLTPFGGASESVSSEFTATPQIVTFAGVVVATGSSSSELSGIQTTFTSGSVEAIGNAIAFVPATEAGIFLPLGIVTAHVDSETSIPGIYQALSSGLIDSSGSAQALIEGAQAQAFSGLVMSDMNVTVSIIEIAELFWQDPRAVTLSKFLSGGGGGIPNSTGSNRLLIDMILTHPKALTSAKLLALGD